MYIISRRNYNWIMITLRPQGTHIRTLHLCLMIINAAAIQSNIITRRQTDVLPSLPSRLFAALQKFHFTKNRAEGLQTHKHKQIVVNINNTLTDTETMQKPAIAL